MTFHCPACNQPAPEPPWSIARRNGFDGRTHCAVQANARGVVAACTGVGHCEVCPVWRALCEQPEIARGGFRWKLKEVVP